MKSHLLFLTCFFISAFSYAQKTDTLSTPSGIKYFFTTKGNGPVLIPGWIAIWQYQLTLTDGTKIDASRDRDAPFAAQYPSKQVIKGVTEALSLMHIGDRGVFIIPPELGYGDRTGIAIPPGSTLVFDMELIGNKEKSLQVVLDSILFAKPLADSSKPHMKEALEAFEKLKKQKFNTLYVSEEDLNTVGYHLIKKSPKDALEFFKLNVKQYPDSWNVYDSVGEAYMNLGDNENALKNYEKSVRMNPDNTNGIDMIKKLKELRST